MLWKLGSWTLGKVSLDLVRCDGWVRLVYTIRFGLMGLVGSD